MSISPAPLSIASTERVSPRHRVAVARVKSSTTGTTPSTGVARGKGRLLITLLVIAFIEKKGEGPMRDLLWGIFTL